MNKAGVDSRLHHARVSKRSDLLIIARGRSVRVERAEVLPVPVQLDVGFTQRRVDRQAEQLGPGQSAVDNPLTPKPRRLPHPHAEGAGRRPRLHRTEPALDRGHFSAFAASPIDADLESRLLRIPASELIRLLPARGCRYVSNLYLARSEAGFLPPARWSGLPYLFVSCAPEGSPVGFGAGVGVTTGFGAGVGADVAVGLDIGPGVQVGPGVLAGLGAGSGSET
ncbi:hypothetical protein ACFWA6_14300 [Streptomyces sp. NPDC060020]|uniref:hypothetical protein n=1 Tax=Streptomyces sp. NPDC060020 TaxID=3347038 RepID=UPI00369D6213